MGEEGMGEEGRSGEPGVPWAQGNKVTSLQSPGTCLLEGLVPCVEVEVGTVLQPHFLSYSAPHFPTPFLVSWTLFACACPSSQAKISVF